VRSRARAARRRGAHRCPRGGALEGFSAPRARARTSARATRARACERAECGLTI
jgi:hypothetical protein